MRTLLHQPSCQADRRACRLDARYRTRLTGPPFHDCRVELDFAMLGQDASATRVETGIFLELPAGGFYGIHGRPALLEDTRPGVERLLKPSLCARFVLRIVVRDSLRTRATVNHQTPT